MPLFKRMTEFYDTVDGPRFRIEKFTVTAEQAAATIASAQNASALEEVRDLVPGEYVNLIDKQLYEVVMSDHPMEHRTNAEVLERAHGDVLIGGLGIGMILLSLQEKASVKSITVIEKYQEIIDLVTAALPLSPKVKVLQGDIFKWAPRSSESFDTIYFDIWNDVDGSNFKQMKALHRRYKRFLGKGRGAWINSWRYGDCQSMSKKGYSAKNPKYREQREADRRRVKELVEGRSYSLQLPPGFTPSEHARVLEGVLATLRNPHIADHGARPPIIINLKI